jgi:Siphovirus Gp157
MSLQEPSARGMPAKPAKAAKTVQSIVLEGLRNEAAAAATLCAHLKAMAPEGETDAGLLSDMVEGETDFFEAAATAIKIIRECEALSNGLKEYRAGLKMREDRLTARAQAYRAALGNALETVFDGVERRPIVTTAGTLSLKIGREEVVIDSEADVPSAYWITPPQPADVIDVGAVESALRANEELPEAERQEMPWAHIARKPSSVAIKGS